MRLSRINLAMLVASPVHTAWDYGQEVTLVHPRGCGKSQAFEMFKQLQTAAKQQQAEKNYQQLAGKHKPISYRMRRQRVK